MFRSILAVVAATLAPAVASAQSLGTFTWQLQPYCNVLTVNVTGVAGVYTLEGFDDQCGATTRAPLTGVATPNPDGTIGFGLNLVTSPGGRGVQVEARIALSNLGGPWADSDGNTGTFAFNQRSGGSPRPTPVNAPGIPPSFGLQADGGFVAGGAAGAGAIPATGPGTRMMWHPAKSAFRAGSVSAQQWDDTTIGTGSVALGTNTVASGDGGFAHGQGTTALGRTATAFGFQSLAAGISSLAVGEAVTAGAEYATAFGKNTVAAAPGSLAGGIESAAQGETAFAFGRFAKASGQASLALGADAKASGPNAVAIGAGVTASGSGSVALGFNVDAPGTGAVALGNVLQVGGQGSVALGYNAGTSGFGVGSFVYGDRSPGASFLQSNFKNEFLVRASGGTMFFSNGAMTTGVKLAPGASAWSSLSDVSSKEHFRDLDGGDVLTKLAAMPIREWNYKAQDAAIRHVGPTAQDFHAAFGLGEDPLRISTIDADGIALAAVKALEARSRTENEALRRENANLTALVAGLQARLDALERERR